MDKIKLIKTTFEKIDEFSEGNFLVLRNFDHIPNQSSHQNDIDVLCPIDIRKPMTDLGYKYHLDKNEYLYEAKPHTHFTNNSIDVHFDVVEGLYYKSLADPKIFVNINEQVVTLMLQRKEKTSKCWMYQPAPVDLLFHLICHSIFDKRTVTDRYQDQINSLYAQCDKEDLRELAKMVFFKFTDRLMEILDTKSLKDLFNQYRTFGGH